MGSDCNLICTMVMVSEEGNLGEGVFSGLEQRLEVAQRDRTLFAFVQLRSGRSLGVLTWRRKQKGREARAGPGDRV